MGKKLALLALAGLLSCSTVSNPNNSNFPKLIAINISGTKMSILEDTNNDGRSDIISHYSILEEFTPDPSQDSDRWYIFKFEDKKPWVSPSQRKKIPAPEYENENEDFVKDLNLDARWSY